MHSILLLILSALFITPAHGQKDSRKSYLEDIFIWKMTDELKLSVAEEKKFSSIQKDLNKRKVELNKDIQTSIESLTQNPKESDIQLNKMLNQHGTFLKKYSTLGLEEFIQMRQLLGTKRTVEYLRIKSELNNKMKSLLAGESEVKKSPDGSNQDSVTPLPPPQVIIEK